MKTARKALLLVLCAALLVSATVMGTVAYLTSQDAVTNIFTVGKVAITLDELDVDNDTAAENDRDKQNDYHLLPGSKHVKDPTVHVVANSEDSYIFVKVVNNIAAIEAEGDKGTIAAQITAKGWTALEGASGVYYKTYTKSATVVDMVVFEEFNIKGDITNDALAAYQGKTIEVTAYAIQQTGFTNANAAWTAGKFA